MAKKMKPLPRTGAQLPTSGLRTSTSSEPSRHSVSEASKAIDARRQGITTGDGRSRQYETGKEGRGDGSRFVRLPTTVSRQSEGLESTAPVSVFPTQRSSSRYDTPRNISIPASSLLNPGHSSSRKPPGRITIPPRKTIDLSLDAAEDRPSRSGAPPPSYRQSVDPFPKPASVKPTAAGRPSGPKQKITTPFVAPSAVQPGKKKVGDVPFAPPTQLAEPEEGNWDGLEWVRKDPKGTVHNSGKEKQDAGASKSSENLALKNYRHTSQSPSRVPSSPPVIDLPSSPPSAQPRLGQNAQTPSPASTPPAQTSTPISAHPGDIKQPLFLSNNSDDEGEDDRQIPDIIRRTSSRRQHHAVSDTDAEEPAGDDTSPTRIGRSSSRPYVSRSSATFSPLFEASNPAAQPISPSPSSSRKPSAGHFRTDHSLPRQPQTYGSAKGKLNVPPPLGRAASEQQQRLNPREQRRAARLAKPDNLQALGSGVRLGSHSRYDFHAPISDVRGSSSERGRTRRRASMGTAPEPVVGSAPPSHSTSTSDRLAHFKRPVELGDLFPRRSSSYRDRSQKEGKLDVGTDAFEIPRDQSRFAHENNIRAGVILHDTDNDPDNRASDRNRTSDRRRDPKWTRETSKKTDRSKAKKRRHASPTYHYLVGGRPPTSLPTDNPAVYKPRRKRRTFPGYSDESEDDEARERRRKRAKKHRWGHPDMYENPNPADVETDIRYQPFSKYGDPVEKDREYQQRKYGVYAIGPELEESAQRTANKWNPRSEREYQVPAPPKLKMSRARSANERVEKYVSVISEHSKSSRKIHPLPIRTRTSKPLVLPAYVVKPLKTISWEEYNDAYKIERPFAINNQLVQRTVAALRAKALKPNQGRNRLRTTRTGIRQDREIRRLESRNEVDATQETERIDTLSPSQRPPVERDDRSGQRRVPKLDFTSRTPPLPPATQAKAQKKKVSTLLMTAETEEEGIVVEEEWGGDVRPDPIIPDFFDEASQVEQAVAQRPANETVRVTVGDDVTPRRVGGKTAYMSTSTGKLKPLTEPTQITTDSEDIGAFLQQHLGEEELRDIESRAPDLEAKRVVSAGKTLLPKYNRPAPPDDIDTDDFPSVPSASTRRSHDTVSIHHRRPAPTIHPAVSETISTSGSNMMSGVIMAEHMMEALQKTKELFDAAPVKAPPPPTGGVIGKAPGRLRRVRQNKVDEAAKQAKTKAKGKGRDPGERPAQRVDSQLTLPSMIEHRPRATQLLSRTGESEQDIQPPPPSARVVVAPPVFAATSPLAGLLSTAPRLGLQRTRTAGLITPLRTMTPLLGGKSMSTLKSQFKPPTQVTPTQLSRPRAPLGVITPLFYPSSDAADADAGVEAEQDYHPDPYNQPGQHFPSPTQATTAIGGRTPAATRSRSRYASTARVSTTQKNSSSVPNMSDMSDGGPGDDDDGRAPGPTYAQKTPAQYNHPHQQYSTGIANNAPPVDRESGPNRQLGTSSSSTSGGGFAPADSTRLIRRTSFSKVMPKHSALKRSTRAEFGPGDDARQQGPLGPVAENEKGKRRRDDRGEGEEGHTGGVKMSRIGSQRARQQFRAPTMVQRETGWEEPGGRR